jgi:DNA-binding response OmpR family regulator
VDALFGAAVGLIGADLRRLPDDLALRPRTSPHVLVIDDDPAFRRFATRAVQLVFYGHPVQISAAGSGPEALEIAGRVPPDVVLLDLGLPSLDGVDVLSRLRDRHATRHASVIVVSGRLGVADRWRFSILGVNEFVTKPVDLEELIRRVQAVADRAGYPTDDSMGDA